MPESVKTIKKEDLPLSCPLPSDTLWNQHPRVFIPLDDDGKGACPYCGNLYQLESDS